MTTLIALPGSMPVRPHHARAICRLRIEGQPSTIRGDGFVIDGCRVRHRSGTIHITGWFTDLSGRHQ